jgi:hypothetical protein
VARTSPGVRYRMIPSTRPRSRMVICASGPAGCRELQASTGRITATILTGLGGAA